MRRRYRTDATASARCGAAGSVSASTPRCVGPRRLIALAPAVGQAGVDAAPVVGAHPALDQARRPRAGATTRDSALWLRCTASASSCIRRWRLVGAGEPLEHLVLADAETVLVLEPRSRAHVSRAWRSSRSSPDLDKLGLLREVLHRGGIIPVRCNFCDHMRFIEIFATACNMPTDGFLPNSTPPHRTGRPAPGPCWSCSAACSSSTGSTSRWSASHCRRSATDLGLSTSQLQWVVSRLRARLRRAAAARRPRGRHARPPPGAADRARPCSSSRPRSAASSTTARCSCSPGSSRA